MKERCTPGVMWHPHCSVGNVILYSTNQIAGGGVLMKSRTSVILTLLCLVAVTGTVAAQETTRGSLVVVVQDPTQAVIRV